MSIHTLCVGCSLDSHRNQGRPCIYPPGNAPFRCPWCLSLVLPLPNPATWQTAIEVAVEQHHPATLGYISRGHGYLSPIDPEGNGQAA